MTALGRRLGRLERAGAGALGPTVIAFLDDWPPEARAAHARARAVGDFRAQEDLLEAHHGVRPRLAQPDGRLLPDGERSVVVHVVVRPDGPH